MGKSRCQFCYAEFDENDGGYMNPVDGAYTCAACCDAEATALWYASHGEEVPS